MNYKEFRAKSFIKKEYLFLQEIVGILEMN